MSFKYHFYYQQYLCGTGPELSPELYIGVPAWIPPWLHNCNKMVVLWAPAVAQWVNELACLCRGPVSLSALHRGLKIQHCRSCSVGWSSGLYSVPGQGTFILSWCGHKKKKKKTVVFLFQAFLSHQRNCDPQRLLSKLWASSLMTFSVLPLLFPNNN